MVLTAGAMMSCELAPPSDQEEKRNVQNHHRCSGGAVMEWREPTMTRRVNEALAWEASKARVRPLGLEAKREVDRPRVEPDASCVALSPPESVAVRRSSR